MMKRFRVAPSPTGNLHIGTLRTTLFNWILAHHTQGEMALRIEDTDVARSKPAFEANIIEGIEWMGLHAHVGPIRQSERMAEGIYYRYAHQLVKQGKAYHCFCSDAQLDAERLEAQTQNIPYVYSKKCQHLSPDHIEANKNQGIPYTIRFAIPEGGAVAFEDTIRGPISFDRHLLSDFVMIKSDNSPSYNFAVVIDDMEMGITDVVRGEDHISNTPRQLLLFEALGHSPPNYAHLPMILGTDRSKLSKRHGATSVTEYRDSGYLPEAMFNYLVLLGWSSPDGEEILSRQAIVDAFELSRVSKSGSIFDIAKLRWMNGQYIRKLDAAALMERLTPFIHPDYKTALQNYNTQTIQRIMVSLQDNLDVLTDINAFLPVYVYSFEAYQKYVDSLIFSDQDKDVLRLFSSKCEGLSFDPNTIETLLSDVMQTLKLPKGKVLKPIRCACTGLASGPHLPELLSILSLKVVQQRLGYVLAS